MKYILKITTVLDLHRIKISYFIKHWKCVHCDSPVSCRPISRLLHVSMHKRVRWMIRIYAQKSTLDDDIFLPFALYTGCVLVIGYWRFSYI